MTLTDLFTNIANAIRAKTGSTEPIVAEDFPSAIEAIPVGSTIDLDAEVTEQETIAASQDTLVGDIMAALEGKAVGGGKTTRTINIDWSGDIDYNCGIYYVLNNKKEFVMSHDVNSIEAEGGAIYVLCGVDSYYTSNIIEVYSNRNELGYDQAVRETLVATQDGETLYLASSTGQGV